MKKILKIILVIILCFVGGAGGFVLIDYFESGGSSEELLTYIKSTVIPSLASACTFITAVYIAATPLINRIQSTVASFSEAKKHIAEVSASGEDISKTAEVVLSEVKAVLAVAMNENEDIKSSLDSITRELSALKSGMLIAYTNTSELVKGGYAIQIADAMEAKNEEEV